MAGNGKARSLYTYSLTLKPSDMDKLRKFAEDDNRNISQYLRVLLLRHISDMEEKQNKVG